MFDTKMNILLKTNHSVNESQTTNYRKTNNRCESIEIRGIPRSAVVFQAANEEKTKTKFQFIHKFHFTLVEKSIKSSNKLKVKTKQRRRERERIGWKMQPARGNLAGILNKRKNLLLEFLLCVENQNVITKL